MSPADSVQVKSAAVADWVSLVMNIEVFTAYNKWLVELNPKLAGENTDWQRKYLATLTK